MVEGEERRKERSIISKVFLAMCVNTVKMGMP